MTDFETQVAEAICTDRYNGRPCRMCEALAPRVAAAIDKSLEMLRMQGKRSVTESGTWWQHWEGYAHDAALSALRGKTP